MKQRGRKSVAELTLVGETAITASERADVPADLTDEQAAEWVGVVNRMPAEWFPRETHACLAQYCRHVVAARRVSQLIEQLCESDEFNTREYRDLLKMQELESRAISSLATRMRITQQSFFDKEKTRGKPKRGKKPWED